jgi:hypothetical protein
MSNYTQDLLVAPIEIDATSSLHKELELAPTRQSSRGGEQARSQLACTEKEGIRVLEALLRLGVLPILQLLIGHATVECLRNT